MVRLREGVDAGECCSRGNEQNEPAASHFARTHSGTRQAGLPALGCRPPAFPTYPVAGSSVAWSAAQDHVCFYTHGSTHHGGASAGELDQPIRISCPHPTSLFTRGPPSGETSHGHLSAKSKLSGSTQRRKSEALRLTKKSRAQPTTGCGTRRWRSGLVTHPLSRAQPTGSGAGSSVTALGVSQSSFFARRSAEIGPTRCIHAANSGVFMKSWSVARLR